MKIAIEEFATIMKHFEVIGLPWTPNFSDKLTLQVWHREFENYTREDIRKMFVYVKSKKWERFPQMAEMLQALHGEIESLTAQAWARVLKLMSNTYKPIPIDEITARALRDILPYPNIHDLTESWNEENIHWKKRDFETAFKNTYELFLRGNHDHDWEVPKISAARGEVPVFKVPKEALRSSNFLEAPPEKPALPPLSAEEVMNLVRHARIEKSIVEPIERVIEPMPKRRSSGLREHLQEILIKNTRLGS